MDSYVVRIYCRAGKKFRILVGTVEVAGTETKTAFSNVDELWVRGPAKATGKSGQSDR